MLINLRYIYKTAYRTKTTSDNKILQNIIPTVCMTTILHIIQIELHSYDINLIMNRKTLSYKSD